MIGFSGRVIRYMFAGWSIIKREEYFNRFLPDLTLDDITPDFAGIRPRRQPTGGSLQDFVIKEESSLGLPQLINLIGIESPGLTSSLAIAELVGAMI